jgi:hypothetical protein
MSVRKVLKSECGPHVEDAKAWLAAETGGQVICAGPIEDRGDHLVIPCFSSDGLNEFQGNGAAAGRKMFTVLAPGVASDGSRYEGKPIEFYFSESLGLEVGDVFSATIPLSTDIDPASVFVESGPSAGRERERFESAGGPEKDARGWQPQGTPHRIAGTPDSGRFSHNGPEHTKE